jgi:hypothetical protein
MNKLILTDKQLDFLWEAIFNHVGAFEEQNYGHPEASRENLRVARQIMNKIQDTYVSRLARNEVKG